MKIHGQEVLDPSEAFGPYDLESTYDRCINCEERNMRELPTKKNREKL